MPHLLSLPTVRKALCTLALTGLACAGGASAQTTVKYGVAAMSVSFASTLIGGAMPEVFAKHGIKVDITDFRGNSNNCVAAVLSGAVDVCQVGASTVSDAVAEGGDFRILAVTTGPLSEFILSSKAVAKMNGVTASSPLDDKLRALKGLRIVTTGPGTPHNLALDASLRRVGMTVADVKFRTLGDTVAMIEGIRNDQIDGAMWTVGVLSPVLADKSGVRWINLAAGDIPEIKPMPYIVTMGLNSWITKNATTVTQLRAALNEAVDLMNKEPAKSSAALKAKYFPQMDQGAWDEGFKLVLPVFFKGSTIPKAGWDYLLKMQAVSGTKDYSKASYEKVLIPEAQIK
jgi:NitT/TauT family transport system substrate-binding protein